MFGMGMSEILIICAVALLIFGPQQLPEMAKKIAKGLKEVRRASDDLKRSINLDDEDERPRWQPKPLERPAVTEPKQTMTSPEPPPAIAGSHVAGEGDVVIAAPVGAVAAGSVVDDDVKAPRDETTDPQKPSVKDVG